MDLFPLLLTRKPTYAPDFPNSFPQLISPTDFSELDSDILYVTAKNLLTPFYLSTIHLLLIFLNRKNREIHLKCFRYGFFDFVVERWIIVCPLEGFRGIRFVYEWILKISSKSLERNSI